MLNTVLNNFYTDIHLEGGTRIKQLPPPISLQVYSYNLFDLLSGFYYFG